MAKADPWLPQMYATYDQCRTQQLEIFRKPDRRDSKKEQIVVVLWPSGFSQLPAPGGIDDQSFWVSRVFSGFLRGERDACVKIMSK